MVTVEIVTLCAMLGKYVPTCTWLKCDIAPLPYREAYGFSVSCCLVM